jgi:isopenicillin N synthase-like dioxygenase
VATGRLEDAMNLFQEQGVKDYAAAASQIPVIDFGPFFAGERGALEELAPQVRHACENVGFFYAANHGVPEELIDRAFAASRRFHALPLDDKLKLRLSENNIGYLPINASVQGASKVHQATRPNQNESFFISHDRGPDHPDVLAGKPLRGRNQWPPEVPGGLPGLRADMMGYFHALGAMCDRMLPAFAAALDMPPDFFAPFFANEGHANLRFLHYPPQDADEDNLFGQAPHTDNSFMTALARTDVPGLAVRLPPNGPSGGEWFPPPVIPGTLLINLGNIMRRWSNDRFLSTPHGVLNDSGTDRYSIAYFHSPNPDSVIECLPSCVSADNPARYSPAVYRDLILEFYRANYFHQKGHRSQAAALVGVAAE